MWWKLIGTLAVTWLGVLALIYVFQDRLLYLPNVAGSGLVADPGEVGLPFRDVWLETADGERLHAWWIPAHAAVATVLFSHGNAGNISHRLDTVREFNRLGLNVLVYDYRGYGQSSGRPDEQGTYADALAAWRYLIDDLALAPDSVVLFGRSLGGAVSAWLAAHEAPGALILESTFTSVPDIAAEIYWGLPARRLARFNYDARKWVRAWHGPLLLIHSREDEIIPFAHAERLAEAAAGPVTRVTLRGGHNTGFARSLDTWRRGVREFLELNSGG